MEHLEPVSPDELELWVCTNCSNGGVFGPMGEPNSDGYSKVVELVRHVGD